MCDDVFLCLHFLVRAILATQTLDLWFNCALSPSEYRFERSAAGGMSLSAPVL